MTLALKYAFESSPNPIRASPDGGPPNAITLSVIISNSGKSITLDGISIVVGGSNASSWLTNNAFPAPDPPPDARTLECAWSGRELQLTPHVAVDVPITLTFPGIVVSEVDGTVPLTITEGEGEPDSTSYCLVKQPNDCIVTNFWAEPASFDTLNQTVTLYWCVTEDGQSLEYQLSAGEWVPRQCLAEGICYLYSDGSTGVQSPGLSDTTVFELDVVRTENGHRVRKASFYVTVRSSAPVISEHSYSEVRGTVALLHWATANATSCQLQVDGKPYGANPPLNTPPLGYPVDIGIDGTSHRFWVDAIKHGASPAQKELQEQGTGAPVVLQGVPAATGGAVPAADGLSAYLATSAGVAVVDLSSQQVIARLDPFGGACSAVALVPGSVQVAAASATKVDLAIGPANTPLPSTWNHALGGMLTDNPAAALAAGGTSMVALAADTAAWCWSLPRLDGANDPEGVYPPPNLASISITPDGNTAMTFGMGQGSDDWSVYFRPLNDEGQGPAGPIFIGPRPTCVAISPDAKLALAGAADQIIVCDGPRLRPTGDPLPIPASAIAFTPDGHVFVAKPSGSVVLLDTSTWTIKPGSLELRFTPAMISVSPLWPAGPILVTGTNGEVAVM